MRRKRYTPVGARPGTLMIPDDSPPPVMSVMRYLPEGFQEEAVVETVAELGEWLERPGCLWIDIQGLGDEAKLWELAKLFEIHPLEMEDVTNVPQRPKTQQYPSHQLYISRMATVGRWSEFEIEQVSVFFNDRVVVTVQEQYGDPLDPLRDRVRNVVGQMGGLGADYLAYAVIDTIIDAYYPAIEQISDMMEELEERVMDRPTQDVLRAIYRVKRTLLELRRGIWPQRDAVNSLIRGDSKWVTEPVQLYLRDTYDHAVQITDIIEIYREMVAGLFNTYLSVVSNRMNEVMKVLTIMASVFIPLTFLVGIYGMNFEVMPELRVRWAYPALLAVMVVLSVAMIVYFKRKGWLGGAGDLDDWGEE